MARSASYPREPLQPVLEFVGTIYRNVGSSMYATRAQMAEIVKRSEGYAGDFAAAATHYGLLDVKANEGYKVSTLFRRIDKPTSELEKLKALQEAVEQPKIYSHLIQRLRGAPLPNEVLLGNLLVREYGIQDAAAPNAAAIFVENLKYVRLLGDGRIVGGDRNDELKDEEPINEKKEDGQIENDFPKVKALQPEVREVVQRMPASAKEENAGIKQLTIPLYWERFATLTLPDDITKDEFELIAEDLKHLEKRLFRDK